MTSDRNEPAQVQDSQGGIDLSPKLIAGAIAVLLLLGFILQNTDKVTINLLWMEWDTRLIWALLISAGIGAIASFLLSTARARSARKRDEMLAEAEIRRGKR